MTRKRAKTRTRQQRKAIRWRTRQTFEQALRQYDAAICASCNKDKAWAIFCRAVLR